MRYLLQICNDETSLFSLSPEETAAMTAEYMAFGAEMGARGVTLGGERLRPTSTATTVEVRNGEVLTTDGPFAETKEQIGGYYLVDCKDLDEAIEVAAKIPGARHGKIEVRPIWESTLSDTAEHAAAERAVAGAFRDEWGRIVATVIRTTGDWDLAEECAQDAFARALERWPVDGVPRNPGAWLTTTARNRAIDRLRRASVGAREAPGGGGGVPSGRRAGARRAR